MIFKNNESNISLSLEDKLLNSTCFILALCSFTAMLLNIAIPMSLSMIIITMVFSLITFTLYILAKKKRKYKTVKWLLIIIGFVFINMVWFFNNGSWGSSIELSLILLSFFILFFENRKMILLICILFINLSFLFIFEIYFPEFIGAHQSNKIRVIDLYLGHIFTAAILGLYFYLSKKNYAIQYKNARKSDELKTAFLENISHELRTPLNAIVGLTGLIVNRQLPPEKKRYYGEIIIDNNKYLLSLVNNIIDAAKIETKQLYIKKTEINLNKLFETFLEYLYRELEFRGKINLSANLNIPGISSTIYTDHSRLKQIMKNLISNAIKFTDSGSIEIGYKEQTDSIAFYVSDTGKGIKEEKKELIFQRFYKVNEDNELGIRGTGLGLFICKQIVELLGGSIYFKSEYKRGSVFTFILPKNKKP